MAFPVNHRLYDVFNNKIMQLVQSGLMDSYIEDSSRSFGKFPSYDDGPQVLTMKHLEAGFVIWMYSTRVAVAGFFLEWLARLVEFYVFKNILSAYFKLATKESTRSLKTVIEYRQVTKVKSGEKKSSIKDEQVDAEKHKTTSIKKQLVVEDIENIEEYQEISG